MNKEQLKEWIMMLNFCAIDMQLYLDTHPEDEKGIAYYNQCAKLLDQAKTTYKEQFGCFEALAGAPYEGRFTWATAKLPWEGGIN